MSCIACQNRTEQKLASTDGVKSVTVSYRAGTAKVVYDTALVSSAGIRKIVEELGYGIAGTDDVTQFQRRPPVAARAFGLLAVIVTAALLFDRYGASVFSAFPTAQAGMGLGMMFVIGLITSVHCIAMCGGINLSQTLAVNGRPAGMKSSLLPSLLYNGGRVVSYTITGGIAGGIGSVFSFSGRARGAVQLAAGIFMVIMGINMLGLFPFLRYIVPHMPARLGSKLNRIKGTNTNPFVIGLLNGLMPCGPLQAMQLYALASGSALRGAAAMLLFALGTVPLMFGLGVLSTVLSRKFTHRVMTVGACIVTVMGITMFSQGWVLSGLSLDRFLPARAVSGTQSTGKSAAGSSAARTENGVQTVSSTLASGRYPSITVQQGIPVKWTIDAPPGSINGCNNRMIIPEYNIEYQFKTGDNTITFTPDKMGTFRYSCWMGMIRSSIKVVADKAALDAAAAFPDPLEPKPSGYAIPVDEIAVARPDTYEGQKIQTVTITLTDEGFSPAVVVLQKDIPARWIINNRSDDDGSAELRVPAYTTVVPLEKQSENSLFVMPRKSFGFSTGDSIFFGYVKTVDDTAKIDTATVKKEASSFETLVYPDDYYNTGTSGSCCAGGGSGCY
ncbi:MAG TPA: heavy metal transporter [Treponema sp.]|nr:heavy metal transporter [Treponema sp.]